MGCGLIFHRFEEAHSRRIPQNRCSREHLGLRPTAVFLIIRSEAFICRKKEKPQKALGIGSPALCGFPTVMTNVADCGVPYGIRPS